MAPHFRRVQIRTYTDGTPAAAMAPCSRALISRLELLHDYWVGRRRPMAIMRNYGGSRYRQRILAVLRDSVRRGRSAGAELETYAFHITILNSKTVGTGAAGLIDQALFVLTSIGRLNRIQPECLPHQPAFETMSVVAAVVATRNVTWGTIKSMYR